MRTYEEVLLECALADERIVVMTAENRAAIRNLPPKLDERFIDVGIAEQTMGDGIKQVYDSELLQKKRLRKQTTLLGSIEPTTTNGSYASH